MNRFEKLLSSGLLVFGLLITGCGSSLIIQNVDFSQPVESVLTPDVNGDVNDQRFAIKFSVNPLLEAEELRDVSEIRLIKNREGYFFITANGFSHVYVLEPGEGELLLVEAIEFPEAMEEPAFNQRGSHIELIARNFEQSYNLDQNGVQE